MFCHTGNLKLETEIETGNRKTLKILYRRLFLSKVLLSQARAWFLEITFTA